MENRIRELRTERRMTQAELATALDVSRQTVNALETGKYDPSLPVALRVAQLFELPLEEIFIVPNLKTDAPEQTHWQEERRSANAFTEEAVMREMGAEGWELTGFGMGYLKFRRPTDLPTQKWAYQRLGGPLSHETLRQLTAEGWSYVGSWLGIAFHYFKKPVL